MVGKNMRLICPNCDAQYEVPDEVIPSEGRDVQCSNCGQTWFQHHPDHPAEEADAPAAPDAPVPGEERAEAPSAPPPMPEETGEETVFDEVSAPQRRGVSPDVADILREEAEQEARARAEERDTLESQPDLGLMPSDEDDSSRNARQARERMMRIRGQEPEDDKSAEVAAATAAAGSRRDLLPDIDEINSTLRSSSDRKARSSDSPAADPSAPQKRGGFRLGFFLVLLIAALGLYVYLNPERVTQTLPQAQSFVEAFVAQADTARAWVDIQVTRALIWVNSLTSG